MGYIGCLFIIAIVIVMLVLSLVRTAFRTLGDVLYGLVLTIEDWWYGLFRPKPTESDIEDMNYFHETEEKPKRYDEEDGDYTSFKEI